MLYPFPNLPRVAMADALYVFATIVFFLVAIAYAEGCEKL